MNGIFFLIREINYQNSIEKIKYINLSKIIVYEWRNKYAISFSNNK